MKNTKELLNLLNELEVQLPTYQEGDFLVCTIKSWEKTPGKNGGHYYVVSFHEIPFKGIVSVEYAREIKNIYKDSKKVLIELRKNGNGFLTPTILTYICKYADISEEDIF